MRHTMNQDHEGNVAGIEKIAGKRAELFALLLKEEQRARGKIPPFQRGRSSLVPVSLAQQRLWIVDQLEGAGAAYHIPAGVRLRGELDVGALKRTLDTIVERHEALRTRF